jgi:hypothetical protein
MSHGRNGLASPPAVVTHPENISHRPACYLAIPHCLFKTSALSKIELEKPSRKKIEEIILKFSVITNFCRKYVCSDLIFYGGFHLLLFFLTVRLCTI